MEAIVSTNSEVNVSEFVEYIAGLHTYDESLQLHNTVLPVAEEPSMDRIFLNLSVLLTLYKRL